MITPLFKSIFEKEPYDYDWQIHFNTVVSSETLLQIVSTGFVHLLANKVKAKLVNPHRIVLILEKAKRKAMKKPSFSYVRRLFERYPKINPNMPKFV